MSDGWDRFWSGAAGQAGEAMLGESFAQNADIAAFWDTVFEGTDKDMAVLDLACGAGSVLRHASALGFTNLTGIDLSGAALKDLKAACPAVNAVQASAANTGLQRGSCDLIVSQFGFEYAGAEACVPEIKRLLKPGGRFCALAHVKDGGIYAEVSGKIAQIEVIRRSDFIAANMEIAARMKAHDSQPSADTKAAFQASLPAYSKAEKILGEYVAQNTVGTAAHLYNGARQLLARRQNYDLSDITGWLENMEAELDATASRLQAMRAAALDAADMEHFTEKINLAGLKMNLPELFYLAKRTEPAAWIMRADKGREK